MALPTDQEVDTYITQKATVLGINPQIAVAISRAERGARSTGWIGDQGSSFGPFQLHLGGIAGGANSTSGLGNVFAQKLNLDPRNIADTWKQQVDFALQWARDVSGWSPFHAAQQLGYSTWDGIRQATGNAVSGLRYFFPISGYSGNPKDTYHTPGATDLFAPIGTPIRAVVDGRVETTSSSGPGGNSIIIKGLDGLDYYYAHMQEPASVSPGDYVAGGQNIGKVGNTGNAAGKDPHLHIGIGNGIASGTGANGGAGQNFDAQTFLSNILANGGAGASTTGVVEGTAQSVTNIGGSIQQGLAGAVSGGVQGIQNYVQDRAASIVLLGVGILLILGSIWAFASNNPYVRSAVKVGSGVVAGPAGAVATAGV